ncbi:aminodeoxychorismate lyase [Chitinivorax sp. B]|uniref:aminodeoxychorismate lyase n=1 Tax=Chitinivorax sp. B TaxID=2502235 RepID=UPI0010F9FC55|nr:aminodeoxychorismate lyase [Chitinivorax sp. B]
MILINGHRDGRIAANDRGVAYGDGVFRTMPIRQGVIPFWARQWDALERDCATLHMSRPDLIQLQSELRQCMAGIVEGVAKITLTRGEGPRGYRIDPTAPMTRIVQAHAGFPYPQSLAEHGVALTRCVTPVTRQPMLAGAKTLNRLDSVLARREWDDPAVFDGLMSDGEGAWLETTMCSLFVVVAGAVHVPDLSCGGVSGVSRELVLTCSQRLSIPVIVSRIDDALLTRAQAVFVANSLAGVLPVVRIAELAYSDLRLIRQIQAEMTILSALDTSLSSI